MLPAPGRCRCLLFTAALAAAPAIAPGAALAQPAIELPPEEAPAAGDPKKAIPRPAGLDLPRESQIDVVLGNSASNANGGSSTGIGAYGELTLNVPTNGGAPIADVRRLVVFLGHNFTDRLRVYTELEVEHAVSSSSDRGEFEVEQVFVDYLARRWLNFRAGLILMPVGIVNQYHEPPTFNGVDRPETDTRIIPSTWRELGAGVFGAAGPVRWQLYGVTSFKAHDITSEGLADAHQEGQLAIARDWGVVGRLDLQPVPGLDVGVSGYYADSGQGDPAVSMVRAGLIMVEADARFRWKGLEARAEFVNLWINDTAAINAAHQQETADALAKDPTSGATFEPVSHQLRGGYVELGYNLLQPFHLKYSSSLVAFGRYERTNTQADVRFYDPSPLKDRQLLTFGLNFRPVAEVSVKVDYQRINAYGGGQEAAWGSFNAGLGFMF